MRKKQVHNVCIETKKLANINSLTVEEREMDTITFETIKAEIDAYHFDENMPWTYRKLNQALDYARKARFDKNKSFTKEDVEGYIFNDNDALDSGEIDEDSEYWGYVREIQHHIVYYFCQ